MSLRCRAYGLGYDWTERECVRPPYTDRVSKERWIWFIVEDEAQVRGTIQFAGCTWRLVEAYTSDRPDSLGFHDIEGWIPDVVDVFNTGIRGRGPRIYDCGTPLYHLVYERASEPKQCGSGRFS